MIYSSTVIIIPTNLNDDIRSEEREIIAQNMRAVCMKAALTVSLPRKSMLQFSDVRTCNILVPSFEIMRRILKESK